MLSLRHRFLTLLLLVACATSALLAQAGVDDLPFSIRRIAIPPQRVAKELEKAPQGTLLTMPLEEFEERLERVRRLAQTRDQKPRLVQAHYSAELIDRALVSDGDKKSKWIILNPAATEAVLPIESINLAMHKLSWEKGGHALTAEFDGNSLGLLVKQAGSQTCFFDWSLRGAPTSEGLSFLVRMPSCPLTTFEIKLPADLWLTAPKSAAVMPGPVDSKPPGKRVWKIQITGQSKLELSLRKISAPPGMGPMVFAQVQSWQQLSPDRVELDYEFNLDILHGSIRSLTLEGDAALQPYDVILKSGEVQSWSWKEADPKKNGKGKPPAPPMGLLTVQFRQPVQGKINKLQIRALSPAPAAGVWASPGLRIRDALSRGETLTVQVQPTLHLGQWDSGSFQLSSLATESNGRQIFTLADAAPDAVSAQRPQLWLLAKNIDLHTRETNRWRLESRAAILQADWDFSLLRGNLYQLQIKLPDPALGYQIESVKLQPPELLRQWHATKKILTVELKQGLAVHKKVLLSVQLRAPFADSATGRRIVDYPQMEPVVSTKREGSVAVSVDRIFQSQLLESSVPLTQGDDAAQEKNGAPTSYLFTFRDQHVKASIQLVPQPAQVQLRGKQTIVLSDRGAAVQFHWEAEPLLGAPEHLDFLCSPGLVPTLTVKADEHSLRIQRWERRYLDEAIPHLLQLGAQNGLEAALLEQALPTGALWRFHLKEPLRKKSHLTLEAPLARGMTTNEWQRLALVLPQRNPWQWIGGSLASEILPKAPGLKAWSLPLMIPAQRLNVAQEITVESVREPIVKVSSPGLRTGHSSSVTLAKAPVHSLLFHADQPPFGAAANLLVWTDPEKATAVALELCDQAQLSTLVHANGRLTHHLQFRLWNWRERTCTLGFSPGIQVMAVKIEERWLDHLDVTEEPAGVQVVLPIDQNTPFVRCEIYACSVASPGWLPGVIQVAQPHIRWPIAPLDFRCRYALVKSLLPLHQEALTPVGMPAGAGNPALPSRWFRQVWNWGESWFPPGEDPELLQKLESQKQAVFLAEAQLRAKTNKELHLADALEQLVLQHLKDKTPLIVDQPALQALGLVPTTMLARPALNSHAARPFWESVGLVYIAAPSGALLTSPRRLESFGLAGAADAAPLDAALQEALLHGRDSSTAFVMALLWARMPPAALLHFAEMTSASAEAEPGWNEVTQWELLPGFAEHLIDVVDVATGKVFGWILAALMGVILWRTQRVCRALTCLRIYLLLVTASILTALWLPATLSELAALPVLLIELAGFLWFLFTLANQPRAGVTSSGSTMIKPAAKAVSLTMVLVALPWLGSAQTPALRSYTVWIVEGTKSTALVPLELKTKLEELENAPNLLTRNAVLVSAKYAGKVKEQLATFQVEYEVYCSKENSALVVPLTGVQLQEGAILGSTPVFPTVHKNGYFVTIPEKGMQRLKLFFSVRIAVTEDHFDLRFTMPKLLQNDMSMQWSSVVQSLHCLHGWGEEKANADPRQLVKEWHAQLGYDNTVELRWSAPTQLAVAKAIEVQELHYWDLRPASFSLFSSLSYTISRGNLGQITLALPEGLHIRTLEVLPSAPAATPVLPLSIKQWRVTGKGNKRDLLIDLDQPVSNQLIVNLEIVPQVSLLMKQLIPPGLQPPKVDKNAQDSRPGPSTKLLLLPLPAPLQGKSILGQVGYRIEEKEPEPKAQNLAVQGIAALEFAETWKKQGNFGGVPAASRAFSFQRRAAQASLELVLPPTDRSAQLDMVWHVDLHHADLSAKCKLFSTQENILMQEFSVPSTLTLVGVQGSEVARWNVRGNLLQVWLRRPCKQAELTMTAWIPLELHTLAPAQSRFTLPCLFPLHAKRAPATLQIQPLPGITVATQHLGNLRLVSQEARLYSVENFPYAASFRVEEKPAALEEAESLTKIHRTEQGVEVWCGIRLTTDRGRLPALKLHLKDWPGETLLEDAPGALLQPLKDSAPQDRLWSLEYEAGLPRHVFIVLRGQIANKVPATIRLPTVGLDKVSMRARWVAWKDMDLHNPITKRNITHTAAPARIAALVDDFAATSAPGWYFAALPEAATAELPKSIARPKIRLLGAGEQLRRATGTDWQHETDYWILALEPATLRIGLPAATASFCVFINGQLHAAPVVSTNEALISLPAAPQPQQVRLCWTLLPHTENLEKPRLAFAELDANPAPPPQRILWIPAGMTLANQDWKLQPTLLERLLHEAALHMHLSAALTQGPGKRADAQERFIDHQQQQFYFCLRLSESVLAHLQSTKAKVAGTDWQQRISALKSANQRFAKELGFEARRLLAEKSKASASIPSAALEEIETGLPLIVTDDMAGLSLQFVQSQTFLHKRTRSELILLIFLSLLVVSFFRQGLSLLQRLVPEIVLSMTLAGMWYFGGGLLGVFILISMLSLRLVRISRFWRWRGQQRAMTAAPSASSKPPVAES